MIQGLINRYKRLRTERFLDQRYQYEYAFVGMGQHSLSNLYPVLHYLQVPLKYICVTSEQKARLIERKFNGVKATSSLDSVLSDDAVHGVFVAASPSAHFQIASKVLASGKSLFIEKPPCPTLADLDTLCQSCPSSATVTVGLQKRYAPAIQLLRKRLSRERLLHYDLHYLTGAYPEGNALLDLFIHPLDLVTFLFGKADIITCQKTAPGSMLVMLKHDHITGTLELSTAYTWTAAEESLKVCTQSGVYQLSQMEELTYTPTSRTILGIPQEKVLPRPTTVEYLYARNNFTPVITNNQLYSQGYFGEISAFVDAVEGRRNDNLSSLQAVRDTYELIQQLSSC